MDTAVQTVSNVRPASARRPAVDDGSGRGATKATTITSAQVAIAAISRAGPK